MATTNQAVEGSAQTTESLPAGFRFAGVACGIKESGKKDLSLIVTDHPSVAAGIYTQTTDVEGEVNGLLTYDRKVQKLPAATLKAIVDESGLLEGKTNNN